MTVTAERDLLATDVMSSPIAAIDEHSSIWQAGDLMLGQRVHHVVVVSGSHCLGVLTDRDILEAWHRGPAALRATPVRELIAMRTACVLPDATLKQVAYVMNVNGVDAVPVVDGAGNAIGIITGRDVIRAVALHGVVVPADRPV
ncbi:MAG TPA: CBS domain-containing protein [Mycobacteriales bacterium]|nr:CBS domain-containing protein [Mycobacteriales bacterium]